MKRQPSSEEARESRSQAERSAATRQALISAARPLFAKSGFAEVSTESVVRAAGVTRGALYHHFADKTELFAAVFETIEAEVTVRIAEAVASGTATDPISVMRLGANAWLDACIDPEIHRVVLVDAPAVLGWVRWTEIGNRYNMGLVQALLGQAIDEKMIPAQPIEPLAHMLLGALREAAMYLTRAEDSGRARADVGAVVDRMIESLASAG